MVKSARKLSCRQPDRQAHMCLLHSNGRTLATCTPAPQLQQPPTAGLHGTDGNSSWTTHTAAAESMPQRRQ
jgi:hypothetical protein